MEIGRAEEYQKSLYKKYPKVKAEIIGVDKVKISGAKKHYGSLKTYQSERELMNDFPRKDKIDFLMKSGLHKREQLEHMTNEQLNDFFTAGLEAKGFKFEHQKKHYGKTKRKNTINMIFKVTGEGILLEEYPTDSFNGSNTGDGQLFFYKGKFYEINRERGDERNVLFSEMKDPEQIKIYKEKYKDYIPNKHYGKAEDKKYVNKLKRRFNKLDNISYDEVSKSDLEEMQEIRNELIKLGYGDWNR